MYGTLITLYIWAIILISLNVVILYINITYHTTVKKQKEVVSKYAKTIEVQTRKEYNKIGTLPFDKLDVYLKLIFAKCIVLASITHVSEKAPSRDTDLFAYTLESMIKYIGEETIDSIDFYYGNNYVYKWVEIIYRAVENKGLLRDINDTKKLDIEDVYRTLTHL